MNRSWSGRSLNRPSTYSKPGAVRRGYRFSYTQATTVLRAMRTLLALQTVVLGYLLVRLVQAGLVWTAFSTLLLLLSSLIGFGVLHSMLRQKIVFGGTVKRMPYR